MGDATTIPRTLLDLFLERARSSPDRQATRHVGPDGASRSTTWGEWEARSRAIAAGLLEIGLAPGARVALLARTRVEWAWLDVAILMAGGISVPIFPNELPATCARVLRDSGARIAIAENPWQLKKLLEAAGAEGLQIGTRDDDVGPSPIRASVARGADEDADAPDAPDDDAPDEDDDARALSDDERRLTLVLIDRELQLSSGAVMTPAEFGVPSQHVLTLADLAARGAVRLARDVRALDARIAAIEPDACVTLCYTPGTEGQQKGVMLTHENLVFTCDAMQRTLGLGPDDVQLLYLPLAQAFGRLSLWMAVRAGASTAFARSFRAVFEDARAQRPTYIAGVPRLFEKAREEITADLDAGRISAILAGWVLGTERGPDLPPEGFFDRTRRDLGERLVKRHLARHFGGQMRLAVSGGAPLGATTARFFHRFGLPLHEGYGLVETTAASHVTRPGSIVAGTVGEPLDGVDFRLLEDGELLLRGPNVTPGYWGNVAETQKSFDREGWFHTGDLARLDEAGQLVITDRKRDIIVTANGKAIAPRPIADKLCADALIGQVLIQGDRRPYLTALVSLRREPLLRFAAEHGIEGDYEALTRHARVFARIDAVVDRTNATLAPHENIRKFAILQTELSAEAGDLTPTLRLKRRVAAQKYRALIDSFYSEPF